MAATECCYCPPVQGATPPPPTLPLSSFQPPPPQFRARASCNICLSSSSTVGALFREEPSMLNAVSIKTIPTGNKRERCSQEKQV